MEDVSESKDYAIEYFKEPRIKNVPDLYWTKSIGWIARLASKYTFDEGYITRAKIELENCLKYIPNNENTVKVSQTSNSHLSQFELLQDSLNLDDTKSDFKSIFSMYEWLQSNQVPKYVIENIKLSLINKLEYYKEIKEGKCLQLNEGYKKYPRTWKTSIIEYYELMISDIDRFIQGSKKPRIHKVKLKKINPEKLLKSFVYQKENNELKVKSLDPTLIFQSNEIWLLNTKYNSITVVQADEDKKLSVRGTTIIDAKIIKTKVIGRKMNEIIDSLSKGTKRSNNKLFTELKSKETNGSARCSEATIILKVY